MSDRRIDIQRYGAELKFNLLDGYILAPYVLVGAGVQNMKYELPSANDKIELLKADHLYFSGAAGVKINLTRRIALTLSGKYLGFRTDLLNPYVNVAQVKKLDKNGLALMNNFSAQAGLSVYLGGYNSRGGMKLVVRTEISSQTASTAWYSLLNLLSYTWTLTKTPCGIVATHGFMEVS